MFPPVAECQQLGLRLRVKRCRSGVMLLAWGKNVTGLRVAYRDQAEIGDAVVGGCDVGHVTDWDGEMAG